MRRYKFSELRGRNDFEYTPDDDIKINSHYGRSVIKITVYGGKEKR